jgi:membrane protein
MSTPSTRDRPLRSGGVGDDRGRQADTPRDVPARGWKDILARTKAEAKGDQMSLLAAGVAFYSLLALVPTLVAMVSIYGLVADPSEVERQVEDVLGTAPAEVRDLISAQLAEIVGEGSGAGLAAVVGIALALFSSSAAVKNLISAINVAYDEDETRNPIKLRLVALAFTAGAVLFVVVSFGVIALVPALLEDSALGDVSRLAVTILRYPFLGLALLGGLAVLYRYGPDRDEPEWRWTSPGAVVAVVLWLVGSLAFSGYAANVGSFGETYGSLAGIVVVMLWLFLSAFVVLLGAELNCELERQTGRDTTEGPPQALGRRGAYAADTVGGTAADVKAEKKERKPPMR